MELEINLTELDNKLLSIPKKELIYLHIMLIGGVIFLSYQFLFEVSEKALKDSENSRKNVVKEIREHRNYLSFYDDFVVLKKREEMKVIRTEIEELRNRKEFLNSQMSALSGVVYEQSSWTEFLNNISNIAKSHNVEIISMQNEFVEHSYRDDIFNNHMNINLKINSNYVNSVSFIDTLERQSLIVNIDSLNVNSTSEGVITELLISVWGIKV